MKVPVYNLEGKKVKEIELPSIFSTPVRLDIIKRAVIAAQKNRIQPYGAKVKAGRESSAKFRGIRRGYGHSYNWGVSRLPRLMLPGGRRIGRVVNVPQAVKGPRAHPPKPWKVWLHKINKKERRLAIRSALAATALLELVKKRGHRVPSNMVVPVVVTDDFEELSRTKDVREFLLKLGLEEELERASRKKVRAGKGKMRGRRYKKAKGPIIIVSSTDKPVIKAARNIPGVDAVAVNLLNAELLAPGTHAGRLAIISEAALKKLEEEKLFQ